MNKGDIIRVDCMRDSDGHVIAGPHRVEFVKEIEAFDSNTKTWDFDGKLMHAVYLQPHGYQHGASHPKGDVFHYCYSDIMLTQDVL